MIFLGVLAAAVIAWFVWRAEPVQGFVRSGRDLLGRGQWRPTAAVVVTMCTVAAAAFAVRGAWFVALPLLAVALWAALFIRRERVREAQPAGMSLAEATALLGVPPDATPQEVREAYRRLMRRAHPDTGGTQGLAAQLNRARDVLLART